MAGLACLLTLVDLADDGADPRRMSVSVRHEAVLADGRRAVIFDDRGWSAGVGTFGGTAQEEMPGIWAQTSVEHIQETARVVVGPDEPPDGHSWDDMKRRHWADVAWILRERRVAADPLELERLPHRVELSERLLARIGPGAEGASPSR